MDNEVAILAICLSIWGTEGQEVSVLPEENGGLVAWRHSPI